MNTTQPVPPRGVLKELILQVSPFCNLNCAYCYLPNRQSKERMAIETVRNTFRQLMTSGLIGESLGVEFHAGEPTAVPRAYYEELLAAIHAELGGRVALEFNTQSNGTLLDQGWCDFLRHHGIGIGISVDGPAWLHDRKRRRWNGRGTHAATMRGIRLLQENDLPFGVISVLSEESLDHADAIFDFYRDNDLRCVAWNPEEIEGVHQGEGIDPARMEHKFRAFVAHFHERMCRDSFPIVVREIDTMRRMILRGRGEPLADAEPWGLISVAANGDYISFSPELLGVRSEHYADFVLGNMNRDDLRAVMAGDEFRHIANDVAAGISLCRATCPYFRLCGGGSPSNKFGEHASLAVAETLHCRLRKQAVADVVLAYLETSAGLRAVI